MTSGLTGNYVHSCLPTVRPVHAAALTALFILPSLVICRRSKGELQAADSGFTLVRAIVAAAWASFLFGWHVHEKAVLTVTLPLTFLAVASRRLRSLAFYVTTVAHFSLLPLIYTPNEQPAVLSTYLLYTLSHYLLLGRSSTPVSSGRLHSLWPIISVLAQVHLIGLFPLLLANRLLLPYVFPRLEFLPLMLVSVYCAVGLLTAFFVYVWINLSWLLEERLADKEAEAENEYYQVKAAFFKKND
ncbi:unnamed protein product [Mesocestoides corti]|uniref:Alpha-1,3-glucosyltransferase n=1 Tax=Mesocestoides corti TaxID=53468 RepID=A0A0R3UMS2_MESCO|nr:unnamed protein product [Mesocestoides corti]